MAEEKEAAKPRREPHPLQDLKGIRKDLAEAIRELKETRACSGMGQWKMSTLYKHLDRTRKEYRRLHIVYGELRGRTREQIEKPPANPRRARCNMPDETRIAYERDYWSARIFKWEARHTQRVEADIAVVTDQDHGVEVSV